MITEAGRRCFAQCVRKRREHGQPAENRRRRSCSGVCQPNADNLSIGPAENPLVAYTLDVRSRASRQCVQCVALLVPERKCEIDTLQTIVDRFPAFVPHRLLWNGHLQTVAGAVLRGGRYPHRAKLHPVVLENGDTTFLHDDRPADWNPGAPVGSCYTDWPGVPAVRIWFVPPGV